jgi:dTDP-glucose pyrophosphorylase
MKVLITTSGTGSRLGEITRHTNKSLVRVGKKPAISYIVDLYPRDTEFVVTVGHKGDHVKDFLGLAHGNRKFIFVRVDKYEGEGTSLGYSMLQAEKFLQTPFVFHACDTIVEGVNIPSLDHNWSMGIKLDNYEQYTSFDVGENGRIVRFNNKGINGNLGHIGLIGVKDYSKYWEHLNKLYTKNPNNSSLNDTATLSEMISAGIPIKGYEIKNWLDIGNTKSLAEARKKISDKFDNLDKVDESLFFFDDFVVKFFSDEKKIENRLARGKLFGNLAPKTLDVRKNFYKYKYVLGETYSEVANAINFESFLVWSKNNLWKKVNIVSKEKFKNVCRDFYETKTKERIQKMLSLRGIKDSPNIINGYRVPSTKSLLAKIDFAKLANGVQTRFHGDYILENIIKTEKGYSLLDWRQDFGGLLESGDMYYDLGKLAHNLVVNHDVISKNLYSIKITKEDIVCDIMRKNNLVECELIMDKFLKKQKLDVRKVKILRALIWLNMSPLHHEPFNLFLYYFGKLSLWKALNEK